MRSPIPILAFCLFLPAVLRAELPPEVYDKLKRDAPEVLVVSVTEVKSQRISGFIMSKSGKWRETVTLRVEEAERSRSGMDTGKELLVVYERFVPPEGWVGARPLPKLAKGARYRVWLGIGSDGSWQPAARGHSFEPLEPLEEPETPETPEE